MFSCHLMAIKVAVIVECLAFVVVHCPLNKDFLFCVLNYTILLLGPTVLAKTVGPKYSSYVTLKIGKAFRIFLPVS